MSTRISVTLNQRIFLIGQRNSVGKTKGQIEVTTVFQVWGISFEH